MVWVPLLACPAVFAMLALLDKPAVAPTSKSVITFANSYTGALSDEVNRGSQPPDSDLAGIAGGARIGLLRPPPKRAQTYGKGLPRL